MRDPRKQRDPARPRRLSKRAPVSLALVAGLAVAVASGVAQGDGRSSARSARALNVTDTAHLTYRKSSGLEEGTATGTLPGTVKIHFEIGPPVKATFTISTPKGWLSGTGAATLHSAGLDASFGGTITVTHGTGRYAHAHGHGGLYGVINRHTYALTVQTTGSLSY
jgi:hypothetical protein